MKKLMLGIAIGVLITSTLSTLNATTLNTSISLDNGYIAYISTDDTLQGTQFDAQNNWFTAYNDTVELSAGVDYFLHVYGYDQGGPAGFLGQFSLIGSDHLFSNGASSLLTNVANWQGNNTGWGMPYTTLTDVIVNDGSSPIWGSWVSGISASAHWIWAGDVYNNDVAYFSTKISATNPNNPPVNPVPEPTTMLLFGTGLAGLAAVGRRKRVS